MIDSDYDPPVAASKRAAAATPGAIPVALDDAALLRFRRRVCWHGRRHYRSLPWRETGDPYAILVSEFMLQQTQVARVLGHYGRFLARFPDPSTLAAAPLADVLERWSGLGYNRRAQALHRTAGILVRQHGAALPSDRDTLLRLPGVGEATAGALLAFAFSRPAVFIETNIRRVFLHQFFPAAAAVADAALLPLVERTVDRRQPRRWYYALMDWGAALGRRPGNPNRRSAHYNRQSPFAGSRRELRGRILRLLTEHRCLTTAALQQRCRDPRLTAVLADLVAEHLLERAGTSVCLAGESAGARAAQT
jgi:A/G-specific adenine glycosylase